MEANKSDAPFSIGQIVILRADPSVSGAVIQALPGEPEYRYVLFLNGNTATYYASQLQAQEEKKVDAALLSLKEFQARLTALQRVVYLQPAGNSSCPKTR